MTRPGREAGSMPWFALLLTVWLVCAGRARRPRGDRWRIRLYAVTLVPVSVLVLVGVLLAIQSVVGGPSEGALPATLPYAQWLGLVTNLVVADIVLQRRAPAHRFTRHSLSDRPPALVRD
ncbi:hypothetical protein JNB_20408 [Janibacter sp. HTCC2649]|nr:hypothetical protein JNB_20408 [Janibacter sp. HTCC2649]